jgi:hypothetical protein
MERKRVYIAVKTYPTLSEKYDVVKVAALCTSAKIFFRPTIIKSEPFTALMAFNLFMICTARVKHLIFLYHDSA